MEYSESSQDCSQPVGRAGLGRAAPEHPTFLGWERGLHPWPWGQAQVWGMDFASLKDGKHCALICWSAKSAGDTGGKEGAASFTPPSSCGAPCREARTNSVLVEYKNWGVPTLRDKQEGRVRKA